MSDNDAILAKFKLAVAAYGNREDARRATLTPEELGKEDARHAAWTKKYERSKLTDADRGLVLTRITIKRWNVIQWWLRWAQQDWKKLASDQSSGTVIEINIRNAMSTARAYSYRRPYARELLDRRVYGAGAGSTTLESAMMDRLSIHSRMRGETRLVAYEYTGKRLRQQQAFERRDAEAP